MLSVVIVFVEVFVLVVRPVVVAGVVVGVSKSMFPLSTL